MGAKNLSLSRPALHLEYHFRASDVIRDIVIGMTDGLTVPFALAAGLSGAVASNHIITMAGIAEIAAGSVAMGLGGYLAACGDAEHYARELLRERQEVQITPDQEVAEVIEVFEKYGVTVEQSAPMITALRSNNEAWVNFMMRFELGLEQPNPHRATRSALTIAGSYILGGVIPITPYFMVDGYQALYISTLVTLMSLIIFGFIKGILTGTSSLNSALQTFMIGGIAATTAFLLARAFS
jgi:VIT1/CCC1 family predicted Fe2+/Mn2+ transporter